MDCKIYVQEKKAKKKGVFEEGRLVLADMKQYYNAIGIKIIQH